MNPYLSEVLQPLLELAATVLTGVAIFLIGALATWVKKKTGIQVSEAKEAWLKEKARDAIHYAEEWARNQTKISGTAPTGAKKLGEAVGKLSQWAQEAGYVNYAKTALEDVITSVLATERVQLTAAAASELHTKKMIAEANGPAK